MGDGTHEGWGRDYDLEYDEDTGSWCLPDTTRTPGYQGQHRKEKQPGKLREIVRGILWQLTQ